MNDGKNDKRLHFCSRDVKVGSKQFDDLLKQSIHLQCGHFNVQPMVVNMEYNVHEVAKSIIKKLKESKNAISQCFFGLYGHCSLDDVKSNTLNECLSFSMPNGKVFQFLKKAVLLVISDSVIGGKKNLKQLLHYVKVFVGMQFRGNLQVDMITKDFQVPHGANKMFWQVYIRSFVITFFEGLICYLLRSYLHWCDSALVERSVVYYPHCIWNIIVNKVTDEYLLKGILSGPLSMSKVVQDSRANSSLGVGVVRFCLKSEQSGLRPICNLSAAVKLSQQLVCPSVNRILRAPDNLVCFFRRIAQEMPSVFQDCYFSTKEAFSELQRYKRELNVQGHEKFFLLKVDVRDCYNFIDHKTLTDVFTKCCVKTSKFMRPKPDIEHLLSCFEKFRDGIFLKINGRFYKQKLGIPQGSSVSTYLCNLYLCSCDRECLSLGKEERILRFVDDYLFLGTNADRLWHLLKALEAGLQKYGLTFNESKVESNLASEGSVSWLGMEITNTLDVKVPDISSANQKSCKWSGLPMSAEACLVRLSRFTLRCSLFSAAFNPLLVRSEETRSLSARRLGFHMASRVRFVVKTCPEKEVILSRLVPKLAGIIRRRISYLVHSTELAQVTLRSFKFHLEPYRGEFKLLLRRL